MDNKISIEIPRVLLKKIMSMLGLNVVCYALLYYVNTIIAKYTNPIDYGLYGLIISTIASVSAFVVFGLDDTSEYFVSLYSNTKKWGHLRGFLRFVTKFLSYVSLPILIISSILFGIHYFKVGSFNFAELFEALKEGHPLVVFAWIVPLVAIVAVTSYIFDVAIYA